MISLKKGAYNINYKESIISQIDPIYFNRNCDGKDYSLLQKNAEEMRLLEQKETSWWNVYLTRMFCSKWKCPISKKAFKGKKVGTLRSHVIVTN